jgi:serine/threonine protein kinase
MSNKKLVRIGEKIGEGSYGSVYAAKECSKTEEATICEKEITDFSEESLVAVKRNFKEPSTTGYSNLRELDMLMALSGHPYIVNLLDVKDSDPFKNTARPMTPVKNTNFRDMCVDKMHFIMEYLPFNGEQYLEEKTCTPPAMKVIIMQLMLAIEYMHAQGIVHRDIRTSNILISVDEEGNHKLVLCDFGLSRIMGDGHSTPGTVTSWYRAPEICCECPYDKKIDIWSAGCVIYEIICGRALLNGVRDDNTDLFNTILLKLPEAPERKIINKLFNRGIRLKLKDYTKYNRKTYVERMALNKSFRTEFNSIPGSLDDLEDLLENMLCLDPSTRYSATKALNHTFFNWTRSHINQIRKEFKPEPPSLPFYEIYPCIERTWVFSLALQIYNTHLKNEELDVTPIPTTNFPVVNENYFPPDQTDWYSNRTLFHALDLFDQYLHYCFTSDEVSLRNKETPLLGKIHSKEETYLRFYACIYQMYKYNSTLEVTLDWEEIVPSVFKKCKKEREKFEELMVYNVTKMMTYRKTLLEISTEFVDTLEEEGIRVLLRKLANMKEKWTDGSVRALYRKFMNISATSPK